MIVYIVKQINTYTSQVIIDSVYKSETDARLRCSSLSLQSFCQRTNEIWQYQIEVCEVK